MLHHRKRVCGGQEKEISRKTCNIAQIKYNSFGDTLYLKGFPFFSFLGARSLRSLNLLLSLSLAFYYPKVKIYVSLDF